MGRLNESRTSAVLDDALAARAVRALAPAVHAQHATTVLVGLDGDVEVTATSTVRARAVLVAADVPHRAVAAGPVLELAYDPEATRTIPARGVGAVDASLVGRITGAVAAHRASITRPEVLDGLAREVGGWLATDPPRALDRRVAAAVEAVRDSREIRTPISPAHLRALFARDVGIPIRTYALWRRALVAMGAFHRVDATAAAHAAGFADLAHFSRTCRRMFGAPPTALGRALL